MFVCFFFLWLYIRAAYRFPYQNMCMWGERGPGHRLLLGTLRSKGIMSLFGRIFRRGKQVSDSKPDERQTPHKAGSNVKSNSEIHETQGPHPDSDMQTATREVTFWRTGFTVEGGPLYLYSNEPEPGHIYKAMQNVTTNRDALNIRPRP